MPEISKTHLGGTMRLGSRPTLGKLMIVKLGVCMRHLYSVDERHRHRYEVKPRYY